jgi:hypothetical protein
MLRELYINKLHLFKAWKRVLFPNKIWLAIVRGFSQTSVAPAQNSTRSLFCYIRFRTSNFASLQSYMLSNDASKPTFNATSHEQHPQIVNRKQSHLYIILTSHFHIKILSIVIDEKRYTETKDCSLVRTLLHNWCSCNVLTLNSSLLW